ncbi:hypothetical protein SK128_028105 [Halocaridina rubra]|uniref:Uncharacterized protein n=1 Tax=Halocaridina rubra TaxID=373956 RepID=A0AAN8WNN7_HALRR
MAVLSNQVQIHPSPFVSRGRSLIHTLTATVLQFFYALKKELGGLGLQPGLCSSDHFRIGAKFCSFEMFLQLWKEVIVGGGQVCTEVVYLF